MSQNDENNEKSDFEPKTVQVNLKIKFECPYCKWNTLENTILTPKDPYKLREAYFKCGNCEVAWEIREVR